MLQNMPSIGMPELLIFFVVIGWAVVPFAAAVWALITLHRVRSTQDAMKATLERIERAVAQR